MKIYFIKCKQTDENTTEEIIFKKGYTDYKKAYDEILNIVKNCQGAYIVNTPKDYADEEEFYLLLSVFYYEMRNYGIDSVYYSIGELEL